MTVLTVLLSGCAQPFVKEKDGMEYKIISDGKGKKIEYGNFFEVAYRQVYNGKTKDSVMSSSAEYGNQIAVLDSMAIPPVYFKIFKNSRKGDSIIVKQMTDSIMKNPGVPPYFKKGNFIVSNYKIVNVYTTRAQADSAYKVNSLIGKATNYKKTIEKIKETIATNAAQMKVDDKLINDYITANKLTATKTEWGTYVALTTPGEGKNLDNNSYAVINYTGKSLQDSAFDSNTDILFKHVAPLTVDMSEFRVIPGWIDGLKLMKKGSKGKLLIPSTLGYGKNGSSPKIKPNECLVFDIEVVDVLTKEQYEANEKAEQEKQQAMMMEQQRKMQEAQQNSHPKADSAAKK